MSARLLRSPARKKNAQLLEPNQTSHIPGACENTDSTRIDGKASANLRHQPHTINHERDKRNLRSRPRHEQRDRE
jgi:hypothetical protein